MPQVVGSELQLEPVTGGLLRREHHPGVVDQQVDPRVPGPQLVCGGADGIQRGQVDGLDHDVRARGGAGDAGGGALALLDVPHCQHHRRTARGEDLGGLEPEAGVRAGDHGYPSLLAGRVIVRPFRIHDPSRSLLTMTADLADSILAVIHSQGVRLGPCPDAPTAAPG